MQIRYTNAQHTNHLLGILRLQQANLPQVLNEQEIKSQGFVTVEHDLPLLQRMNQPIGHTIALFGDQVVGYALTMMSTLRADIPILMPMFEKIDRIKMGESLLRDLPYVVMGQVCVDKAHRGQGIFDGLYLQMQKVMKGHFEYIITEVATRNTRSMRAHERVGFTTELIYTADNEEEWAIIALKV